MKKIIIILIILCVILSLYFFFFSNVKSEKLIPFIPQKELYSWTTTGEPSKFKYVCSTGTIRSVKLPSLGGAPYECSDGSQIKMIREMTVKCRTGFVEYDKTKSIPFICSDNSELIIETLGYPRYETALCQRQDEEPYLEVLYITDESEERKCNSLGNPKLLDIVQIY